MATSKIMIDNERTIVTSWVFEPGEETGQHIHEYDYVVVPMKNGELKLVDHTGLVSISKLQKGISYYKEKGVNHNVINNNDFAYSFIEIEFK
tara:strand:+ start:1509 stop:1784 length:276 start_codon:yes stop_codon:yes gene_type:complete